MIDQSNLAELVSKIQDNFIQNFHKIYLILNCDETEINKSFSLGLLETNVKRFRFIGETHLHGDLAWNLDRVVPFYDFDHRDLHL